MLQLVVLLICANELTLPALLFTHMHAHSRVYKLSRGGGIVFFAGYYLCHGAVRAGMDGARHHPGGRLARGRLTKSSQRPFLSQAYDAVPFCIGTHWEWRLCFDIHNCNSNSASPAWVLFQHISGPTLTADNHELNICVCAVYHVVSSSNIWTKETNQEIVNNVQKQHITYLRVMSSLSAS